jgi:hypothetical protein
LSKIPNKQFFDHYNEGNTDIGSMKKKIILDELFSNKSIKRLELRYIFEGEMIKRYLKDN